MHTERKATTTTTILVVTHSHILQVTPGCIKNFDSQTLLISNIMIFLMVPNEIHQNLSPNVSESCCTMTTITMDTLSLFKCL